MRSPDMRPLLQSITNCMSLDYHKLGIMYFRFRLNIGNFEAQNVASLV
jgi:hypothetical protein